MSGVTEIDSAAGLKPGSEVYEARRSRPDFVDGTEECRASVIAPANDKGLDHNFRSALAARLACWIGQPELVAMYKARLSEDASDEVRLIADGVQPESNPMILAMVRHADLVTKAPKSSTARDITLLSEAGLSNPQIVALSELIAFVNYEARVVAGLRILAVLS